MSNMAEFKLSSGTTSLIAKQYFAQFNVRAMAFRPFLATGLEKSKPAHNFRIGGGFLDL